MVHVLIISEEEVLAPLTPYSNSEFELNEPFSAATSALSGIIAAASLPFQLVNDHTLQRKFDRFHAAENILALKRPLPEEKPIDTSPPAILERSKKRMEAFLGSKEGETFVRNQVIAELSERIESAKTKEALQELLIQTTISTWSILETFFRSFFVLWLNKFPADAIDLINNPSLKDFNPKQTIDIKTLSDTGFDLSDKMGEIILGARRLDSLAALRAIAKSVFNSPTLSDALAGDLWILNQRRHLFIHKRGIIDSEYLTKTGENLPLGERLTITSKDVERHMKSACRAIVETGKAASSRFEELNTDT